MDISETTTENKNKIVYNGKVIDNDWMRQSHAAVLIIEDEEGQIEITAKELRRIKELLQEHYPEDYI
jgi:tRNA(Ile2) C34 agmatinyltransferase TiaS